LPSGWDIDRSNSAGKESSKSEEGWRNNSKSWDSLADRFMNRIEHNSEMIRNISHKIDYLKDLIDKLIKDSQLPPKEQFVIGIGIPLACSKLGGVPRYHIISFCSFTFQVESYHE
jgi:hypothetical protein